jgi:hypothetical protein
LKERRTIEDDGHLHQAGKHCTRKRESSHHPVFGESLTLAIRELCARSRRQLAESQHGFGEGGKALVGAATVDTSHFFAGADWKPAVLEKDAHPVPGLARAHGVEEAGFHALLELAEVGQAQHEPRKA